MTLEVRAAEPFEGCPVGEAFVARENKCGGILFIPSYTMACEGYPWMGGNRRGMGRRPAIPAPTNLSVVVFSNWSRQFEGKYAPNDEYDGDGD
jgi:hypothetical protein